MKITKSCRTILNGAWILIKAIGLFFSPIKFWEVYFSLIFAFLIGLLGGFFFPIINSLLQMYFDLSKVSPLLFPVMAAWLHLLYKTYKNCHLNAMLFCFGIIHILWMPFVIWYVVYVGFVMHAFL